MLQKRLSRGRGSPRDRPSAPGVLTGLRAIGDRPGLTVGLEEILDLG